MSDTTRDDLAKLIDQLLGDPETDTVTREFLARETATTIVERYLVIPRSDIVGTEYGWRAGPTREVRREPREIAARVVESSRNAQRVTGWAVEAEAVERPVLPWSVIPLHEDGEADG